MPKFVSGSSGHIYAYNKGLDKDKNSSDPDSDLKAVIESATTNDASRQNETQKPSAINKKGLKEKQKNSLDLFREELRKLNEERDEQRNKIKQSISNKSSDQVRAPPKPLPAPVPLKPDPRCPTTLTLQVNLNPKDKDSTSTGSFDTGDPTTTNLYVGNLNPSVNENDLCDIFGKFGPLASIKIMWPRTDEERARNRNSGFVAYMSRVDAERALKTLNGREFRSYDMKLGWGKAVPLPQNPVYIPPELQKLLSPPPKSGLPFNAQLHDDDKDYIVPHAIPRPPPAELGSEIESNSDLNDMQEAFNEFQEVFRRSTVRVTIPTDRPLLDRIHKTIEYVIREGPVFEAIIIARECKNLDYSFLYDNQSQEHVYYRWKLYSLLHGDDLYEWQTSEFRMFEDGPIWKPPPMNPFVDGMPLELVEKYSSDVLGNDVVDGSLASTASTLVKNRFVEGSRDIKSCMGEDNRKKGTLGKFKRDSLGDILRNLDPTRAKIGDAMIFCISHSDAAQEIIDSIYESLLLLETPFQRKVARLFLVSDILHNCSAAVTNASYYRKGFQLKLESIFEHLREYLVSIEDRYKSDRFKQKVLSVLGAWKEWTLYEDEFVIKLSNILLGIKSFNCGDKHKADQADDSAAESSVQDQESINLASMKKVEEDLDGEPIDDETLDDCLEAKGLSLRWYKALELSDDEEEDLRSKQKSNDDDNDQSSRHSSERQANEQNAVSQSDKIRFKTSKWETVDPSEVAEQVVTMSKWDLMASKEECEGSTDSGSNYGDEQSVGASSESPDTKRLKRALD